MAIRHARGERRNPGAPPKLRHEHDPPDLGKLPRTHAIGVFGGEALGSHDKIRLAGRTDVRRTPCNETPRNALDLWAPIFAPSPGKNLRNARRTCSSKFVSGFLKAIAELVLLPYRAAIQSNRGPDATWCRARGEHRERLGTARCAHRRPRPIVFDRRRHRRKCSTRARTRRCGKLSLAQPTMCHPSRMSAARTRPGL